MLYYFECLLFFIISIVFMYVLGSAINSKKTDFSNRLVSGFIIYYFFVAIVGVPIQVLRLPYVIFYI